jgi:hypothetical protein
VWVDGVMPLRDESMARNMIATGNWTIVGNGNCSPWKSRGIWCSIYVADKMNKHTKQLALNTKPSLKGISSKKCMVA